MDYFELRLKYQFLFLKKSVLSLLFFLFQFEELSPTVFFAFVFFKEYGFMPVNIAAQQFSNWIKKINVITHDFEYGDKWQCHNHTCYAPQ